MVTVTTCAGSETASSASPSPKLKARTEPPNTIFLMQRSISPPCRPAKVFRSPSVVFGQFSSLPPRTPAMRILGLHDFTQPPFGVVQMTPQKSGALLQFPACQQFVDPAVCGNQPAGV